MPPPLIQTPETAKQPLLVRLMPFLKVDVAVRLKIARAVCTPLRAAGEMTDDVVVPRKGTLVEAAAIVKTGIAKRIETRILEKYFIILVNREYLERGCHIERCY